MEPCIKCGSLERYSNGECATCSRKRAGRWNKNNREQATDNLRNWRNLNPEQSREHGRKQYRANPQKRIGYIRNWEERNPDKPKLYEQRRRARKQGSDGEYSEAEWKALVKQQGGRCLACGKKTELTADHVIPLVKGGSNDISNIQGLCRSCNSTKGTKATDHRTGPGIIRWIQKRLL